MSGVCFEVPPLRRDVIMGLTEELRAVLQINTPFFPILEVVEFALPTLMPDFSLEVREMSEMGDNHGLTYVDRTEILVRVDVYEGVEQRKGRDRFTLAHELGHLVLHNNPGYARNARKTEDIPPYRSSEWQANTFAGSLLMPLDFLRTATSLQEVAEVCGVSFDAAETHTRLLTRAKILNNGNLA